MVDRRWAIDWDEALAPPLAMIPDLSVFVSLAPDDAPETASSYRQGQATAPTTGNDEPLPLQVWENALLAGLVGEEEECGSAFQRDPLHIQSL